MKLTETLTGAIFKQRLVFCALLVVYAFILINVEWLGTAVMRDGSWQRAFSFKAKPVAATAGPKHSMRARGRKSAQAQPHPAPNNFQAQTHLMQDALVKTAKSTEVQAILVALTFCLVICLYLHLYLSVPAAVRYRLRIYLKRLFAKWAARKRAEILSQDTRLGDLLVACKVISQEELDKAVQDGDNQKGIEMLVHLGQISDHQLQSALAIQTRLQKRGSRKEKAFAWLSPDGREERQDQKAARTEAISRLRTHI